MQRKLLAMSVAAALSGPAVAAAHRESVVLLSELAGGSTPSHAEPQPQRVMHNSRSLTRRERRLLGLQGQSIKRLLPRRTG